MAPAARSEMDRRTAGRTERPGRSQIPQRGPGGPGHRTRPRQGPPRHVTRGDAAVPRSRHSPGPRRERSGSRRSRSGARPAGGWVAAPRPSARRGGEGGRVRAGTSAALPPPPPGRSGRAGWPRGCTGPQSPGAALPPSPGAPRRAPPAPGGGSGRRRPALPPAAALALAPFRWRRRERRVGGAGRQLRTWALPRAALPGRRGRAARAAVCERRPLTCGRQREAAPAPPPFQGAPAGPGGSAALV